MTKTPELQAVGPGGTGSKSGKWWEATDVLDCRVSWRWKAFCASPLSPLTWRSSLSMSPLATRRKTSSMVTMESP